MPLYDYECPKCGAIIEFMLPFDHEKPKCPKCDYETMTMKFGVYSIHMKAAHSSTTKDIVSKIVK